MNDKKQMNISLRLWSEDDLPLLIRLMGNPAMTDHLGGPESPEKIRERHKRYCQSSVSGKDLMYVIALQPEMTPVGSIGYWEKEWQGEIVWETGWSILPEFQGYGIATKAAILIIDRARAEGKHRFIHAFPSTDNAPSNSVCRKAGFMFREEANFEYPPGNIMRCNDWRFDLFAEDTNEK